MDEEQNRYNIFQAFISPEIIKDMVSFDVLAAEWNYIDHEPVIDEIIKSEDSDSQSKQPMIVSVYQSACIEILRKFDIKVNEEASFNFLVRLLYGLNQMVSSDITDLILEARITESEVEGLHNIISNFVELDYGTFIENVIEIDNEFILDILSPSDEAVRQAEINVIFRKRFETVKNYLADKPTLSVMITDLAEVSGAELGFFGSFETILDYIVADDNMNKLTVINFAKSVALLTYLTTEKHNDAKQKLLESVITLIAGKPAFNMVVNNINLGFKEIEEWN